MLILPYSAGELDFAYCYRVYLRWRTHRGKAHSVMPQLDLSVLRQIGDRYNIHILESKSSETDTLLFASLQPAETVSGCASKMKGQASKWLRERLGGAASPQLLANSYFGCTVGATTDESVKQYLERQGEHHGYAHRPRPPIYVHTYELTAADEDRLAAKHARALLQHHIVLATYRRQGVFGASSGEALAECWREMLVDRRAALVKVSFVPDHVHIAVRVHPAVSPSELIVRMMNISQEVMWHEFADSVIGAGVKRLWQPSAYLGSCGSLESARISKYLRDWEAESQP